MSESGFRTRSSATYLLQILSPKAHIPKELVELLVLLPPPRPAASPITATLGRLRPTLLRGKRMHTTTSDADGDESVTDLAHDDAPVCAPLDCSADCSQFRLPIRVYLVLVFQGDNEAFQGRERSEWCGVV